MNEYFCTSPAHAPITFVMVRGSVSYTTQTLTIRRLCCHFSQSLKPSQRPLGVFPGIFVGVNVVPPSSSNPDPISDQKNVTDPAS